MTAPHVQRVTFDPPLRIPTEEIYDAVTAPTHPVNLAGFDPDTRRWFRSEYRRLRSVLSPGEAHILLQGRYDVMDRISRAAIKMLGLEQ